MPERQRTSGPSRYAAVDVHYPAEGGAYAGLVVVCDTEFSEVAEERVAHLAGVAPYRPGDFFRRELPALRAVLGSAAGIGLLVIDGYVDLDPPTTGPLPPRRRTADNETRWSAVAPPAAPGSIPLRQPRR